jgi:hypothetical protein
MSAVARPHGFTPVKRSDGLPYAGVIDQYPIASGAATPIGYGDLVSLDANGQLVRTVSATSGTVSTISNCIGVFVGCEYTEPNLKYLLHSHGYPGGVVANDITGYVVADPEMLFEAQASGPLTQTNVGNNIGLVAAAPTGAGGNLVSRLTLAAATAAAGAGAATLPFRIVALKKGPDSTPGDAFTDVLVRFNFGQHIYHQANGV